MTVLNHKFLEKPLFDKLRVTFRGVILSLSKDKTPVKT